MGGGLEEEDSRIVQDVTRFLCFIGHQLQVEQTLDDLVAKEFIVYSHLWREHADVSFLDNGDDASLQQRKVMVLRAGVLRAGVRRGTCLEHLGIRLGTQSH